MEQVRAATDASAELARRMTAAGNFSKLDQAREQVFYAESTAHLARVRQIALAERERLTRLMGLWGEDIAFRLPERLPDLPKTAREIAELESQALKQRLDVQASMKEAENIAASLGLVKATGFINVIEIGYQRNSESGLPRQTGYEIELRLPIFDWGGARVARAEHTYMQAVNRAADLAVRARSEVREAYGAYRTAFDLARHYRDEIVPLRKRISEENLLRYNGMLISVFELLGDARQQIISVNAYIEALRDFWLTDSTLQLAMTGASPGAIGVPRGPGMQAVSGGIAEPGH
jgi:outer membrane protein TolC